MMDSKNRDQNEELISANNEDVGSSPGTDLPLSELQDDTDSTGDKLLVKNPLDILEVMENLMKNVGREDLMKCRLVCKLWDEAVVRTVTSTPLRKVNLCGGPRYILSQSRLESFRRDSKGVKKSKSTYYIETKRLKIEPEALKEFSVLLNKSQWPQLLLKNVSISSSTPPSYNASPIDIPEIQKMLVDYGQYVKNLEVSDKEDFKTLIKCVGQNGYCPNIQVLRVVACKDDSSPESKLGQIGKLKLKLLTLDEGCASNNCTGVSTILDKILKNGAEINSLIIRNTKQAQTTNSCLALLQNVPHFTKNLKGLLLIGNVHQNWDPLCKIQFQNLKIVKLRNVYNAFIPVSKKKKKEGLKNFLKVVSESLEYFEMRDDTDKRSNGFAISDLPLMPRLKETSRMASYYADYDVILEKFPALRVLSIPGLSSLKAFVEKYFETKNQLLLPNSSNLVPNLVHKHLERIETMGEELLVYSPVTIQMLNAVCPQLRELDIQLQLPPYAEDWVEGQQLLFDRIFHAISKMKNLKELCIEFEDWEHKKLLGAVDLTPAFSSLKELTSLEIVTIRGYEPGNLNYTYLLTHLLALIGAPKVQLIVLPDFPVIKRYEDSVLEVMNKFTLGDIILKVGTERKNERKYRAVEETDDDEDDDDEDDDEDSDEDEDDYEDDDGDGDYYEDDSYYEDDEDDQEEY